MAARNDIHKRRGSPPLSDHKWDTLIRDIPMESIATMGDKLSMSVGKNFQDLAGLLGFKLNEVDKIKRESAANPGRRLLNIWSQREGTTARALKRYLEQIERYDVRRDLMKALSEPIDLVVVVRAEDDTDILYDGVLHSFGQESVYEALETEDETRRLMPFCDTDRQTLKSKAASFKGRQITLHHKRNSTDIKRPDPSPDIPLRSNPHTSTQSKPLKYPAWTLRNQQIETSRDGDRLHTPTAAAAAAAVPTGARPRVPPQGRPRPEGEYDGAPTTDTLPSPTQLSSATISESRLASETCTKTPIRTSQVPGQASGHSGTHTKYIPRRAPPVAEVAPQAHSSLSSVTFAKLHHSSSGDSFNNFDTRAGDEDESLKLDLRSVDEGEYITPSEAHTEEAIGFKSFATNTNIIQNLFLPHLYEDGRFITRPSRDDPSATCISVMFRGEVVNYRVHSKHILEDGQWVKRYYLFEGEQLFPSMFDLITFFRRHPMKSQQEDEGPILTKTV